MSPRDDLAKLFRIFAAVIDGLDQRQLDQLLPGKESWSSIVRRNSEKRAQQEQSIRRQFCKS
jgi:hypothetical protein